MDVNDLRAIITLACFIAFLCIVYWAYSGRQKSRFDEAANLPFADDDMQERTLAKARNDDNQSTRDAEIHQTLHNSQPGFAQASSNSPIRKEQDHG